MYVIPSKKPHPLRIIRDALSEAYGEKISQPVFAKRLGVSASLINAIESSRSREVSEDLHKRIAMRFGVRLSDVKAGRIFCTAFPDLPLVDGLLKYRAEFNTVEADAVQFFDRGRIPLMRACMLAAFKARKASIFLDVLGARVAQIMDELKLDPMDCWKTIEANRGQFPAEVFEGVSKLPGGGVTAYAKAQMAALHGTTDFSTMVRIAKDEEARGATPKAQNRKPKVSTKPAPAKAPKKKGKA